MARNGKEESENNGHGKYGKFVDENNVLERAIDVFTSDLPKSGGNLGLRGEKGSGKTLAIHKLCDKDDPEVVKFWKDRGLEVPELLKFSAHEEQGYVDIVAQDILVGGETRVREQILLKWLKPTKPNTPRILLIDEANFMSQAVAGFLHSLADWQEGIWVPELSTYYTRSPLHFLAVCVNPSERSIYTGTKEMNAALMDRFTWIDVDYMGTTEEVEWLGEMVPNATYADRRKLVEFAKKTRDAYRMDMLHVPVTPRNLLKWLTMLTKYKRRIEDLKGYVAGMQLIDQRKQVLALWEGKEIEEVFKQAIKDDEED